MNLSEPDLDRYLPNGEQAVVVATHYDATPFPRITFRTDAGELYEEYRFHPGYFKHHRDPKRKVPGPNGKLKYKNFEPPEWKESERDVLHLDFAAVATVHSVQGSQWDRVLLYDDGFLNWPGRLDERKRWLYTGFTRAAKELTWAM